MEKVACSSPPPRFLHLPQNWFWILSRVWKGLLWALGFSVPSRPGGLSVWTHLSDLINNVEKALNSICRGSLSSSIMCYLGTLETLQKDTSEDFIYKLGTGWQNDSVHKGGVPRLITRVYSPGPTWWEERTNSCNLSSDLHMFTVVYAHTQINKINTF